MGTILIIYFRKLPAIIAALLLCLYCCTAYSRNLNISADILLCFDTIPKRGVEIRYYEKDSSNSRKDYYHVNMRIFPSEFEKKYFVQLTYHSPVLVVLNSDISGGILTVQANKSHELSSVEEEFRRLKGEALAAGRLPIDEQQLLVKPFSK